MSKKSIRNQLNKVCKDLNSHLPVKSKEDIDALNDITNKAFTEIENFNLYFDRDVFIDCGCDGEKVKDLVRKTDKVYFGVSDDIDEHPGAVIRYKEQH